MHIIVKQPINLNGTIYEKGDEITKISKASLIKLNEKGYIEPLTAKEIQNFGKEIENKKSEKEDNNGRFSTKWNRKD